MKKEILLSNGYYLSHSLSDTVNYWFLCHDQISPDDSLTYFCEESFDDEPNQSPVDLLTKCFTDQVIGDEVEIFHVKKALDL